MGLRAVQPGGPTPESDANIQVQEVVVKSKKYICAHHGRIGLEQETDQRVNSYGFEKGVAPEMSRSCGDVHRRIAVMQRMKSPERRNPMLRPMEQVLASIHRQRITRNADE